MSAKIDADQDSVRSFKPAVDHNIMGEYDMREDLDRGCKIVTKVKIVLTDLCTDSEQAPRRYAV